MPRNRPSSLDRSLRLFAEVRSGESRTVLLLTLNVFLLLTAYYFIKPVREALILEGGGAEVKSYSAAGQAILLLVAVPVYGALASRFPRRHLINIVTTFFAASFLLFFSAEYLGVSLLIRGIVFYLWIGIFNLMIIAQFWSFANDIYTREEGERLFPIIAFGASSGAVLGSFISGQIIELLGVNQPILFAAALLMLSLIVTNYVDAAERREKEAGAPPQLTSASQPATSSEIRLDEVRAAIRRREAEEHGEALEEPDETEREGEGGESLETGLNPFVMVLRCRYLLYIGLLMLFLNWVNTTGEYILGSVVEDAAVAAAAAGAGVSEGEFIGTFYSSFFGVVNVLALVLQLFIVSRVIKYLGVRIALLILPVIALGAYGLLAFYPILAYVRWAKTAENSTDYSLQNTVRNVLFLPCTREQKYKAKQAIDSFFVRAGDVLSALLVFVGTTYLAMQASHFAAFNIVLVCLWLVLAVLIGRDYRRLVREGRPPCPATPGRVPPSRPSRSGELETVTPG